MFSLISEAWLPAIDCTGQHKKISPLQLADDTLVDLAWPRADFQGAAYQLLIGLLQTACPPKDDEAWGAIWEEGFDEESLQQALSKLASAFNFGPEKPAFLQDFATLPVENSSIAGLLIDAPGGNTQKLNKDHFVKRASYQRFCPHCAAIALFTVQTNSPAGGAGFRVSMRGGGPMTTLMMPQDNTQPLWRKLWLNVLPDEAVAESQHYPLIFPWLTETRSSESAKNITTPENAHPLQAYWGMPRRLEIDFQHTEEGLCDLCGESHQALLTQMRSKNYGVQYDGWRHPLSPYRQALKDNGSPWIPLKGQPGGLVYKDWLGLVTRTADKFNRTVPARVSRDIDDVETRLWCFGYDMDNAKVRCWYEHRLPIGVLSGIEAQLFEETLRTAVNLALGSLPLLKTALKEAWFETPSEAKGDFSAIDIAFWQQTEPCFRMLWQQLTATPDPAQPQARQALLRWMKDIQHYLFNAFDQTVLTNPDEAADLIMRTVKARRKLAREFLRQKSLQSLQEITTERKEATSV